MVAGKGQENIDPSDGKKPVVKGPSVRECQAEGGAGSKAASGGNYSSDTSSQCHEGRGGEGAGCRSCGFCNIENPQHFVLNKILNLKCVYGISSISPKST